MRLYLFVPWLFMLISIAMIAELWWSARTAEAQQQFNRQQFISQLAAAIESKPAWTNELLTAASEICQCTQLRLQRRNGVAEFVSGSVSIPQAVTPDGWSSQQDLQLFTAHIDHNYQLVAVFSPQPWRFHWLQILILLLTLFSTVVTAWFSHHQSRQQKLLVRQFNRLTEDSSWDTNDFTSQMQLLHVVEVETLQRRQLEQDLRLQITDLTQQLHSQQSHMSAQVDMLQRQLQQLKHDQHRWLLLAQRVQQLPATQLPSLITLLADVAGYTTDNETFTSAGFTRWFRQQFEFEASLMHLDSQLLPHEDPAICRWQVDVDYRGISMLSHALLEMVRAQNTGPEILFGYQLFDEVNPYLALTLQYNGRVLPAKTKQVLKLGGQSDLDWQELMAELVHLQMLRLNALLDMQELTDVGSRLTVKIPICLTAKPEKKLCQNMLVYDNREFRQGLWRHALQGVAEQLLLVSTFADVLQTANSRLIDMLVLHLREETFSVTELEQLKTLAQRYPVIIFASSAQQDVSRALADFARVNQTPILLGAMCEQTAADTLLAQQQLLVVDDNQTNLSFIRAMLAGMGLGIDYATSGHEAIQLAEQTRYQLILMDIQLPDLSGMDVTKRIRQLRHHQNTEVLAFTAHALPEEVAGFKLAGMDDVLFKPLDERKIAHILQRLKMIK